MDRPTVELVLQLLERESIKCLDLTGGAPEMNPEFRYLVTQARKLGVHVIDRCNLTILVEPGYEDLAQFLADHEVEICASLPCYTEQNVNEQRGRGVFEQSIDALKVLNKLGYGDTLPLNLAYNPNGAFLPPPQVALEQDYKRELGESHGIEFNHLMTITNMPISRFGAVLLSKGQYDDYINLLKSSFKSSNLAAVMCTNLISVDWQGYIYDCDFNQMLEFPIHKVQSLGSITIASDKAPGMHLSDLIDNSVLGRAITVGDHCYGCTAGQGSSCSGAL